MKQLKPRNFVALALTKRGGSVAHTKSNKAKRSLDKQMLLKDLKKPSNKLDGFYLSILIKPPKVNFSKNKLAFG